MPNQQYQQTYPNSCGASCLLCAAIELGTNQLPPTPAYPLWAVGINPLATNRTGELALYSVTCGKGGVAPLPTDGYSMPSHIYDACTAMGRTASAYVPSSLIGALLQLVYREDVARAQQRGMVINHTAAPEAPGANQRLLRVMRVGEDSWSKPNTGLHYIMVRPDGSVMDPALGLDANNLAALMAYHKTQAASYKDTGIGILVG